MHKVSLGTAYLLFSILSLHAQSPLEKGLQSINRTSAEAIVEFLADDELQGREAGMHGSRVAARYIVSRLKQDGIRPLDETAIISLLRHAAGKDNNAGAGRYTPTPLQSSSKAHTVR